MLTLGEVCKEHWAENGCANVDAASCRVLSETRQDAASTNGVVTNHTYDPWGRLSTRTRGAYAASYEWRYGDKLKTVTSNFPGEAASVAYDYDGFGQRRNRSAGTEFTWWRYDLGGGTATEYTDPDTDGDIEGFSKFNVMMGMMHPLAEASVPSGQPPANAAYSYLALDHLSSTRAVFSQAKAQTAAMEFFPYGGRLSTSGTLPHHQFTAKPYDTGTGQYYFPYRYYAPAMARWTAADPAGTMDGSNVYGYVRNAPISIIDPEGLFCVKVYCQITLISEVPLMNFKIEGTPLYVSICNLVGKCALLPAGANIKLLQEYVQKKHKRCLYACREFRYTCSGMGTDRMWAEWRDMGAKYYSVWKVIGSAYGKPNFLYSPCVENPFYDPNDYYMSRLPKQWCGK